MEVFTPQKSVNTANQGFFPLKRQLLNIYQQTPAYHPHKICEQNLSNFLTSLINSCPLSKKKKKKNPLFIILPSEYTDFAISLLEILRYLTTATLQAFSPLSCFLLNACYPFFEYTEVCPQRDIWVVDVQNPAHPAKKALRLPTAPRAPWM